MRFLLFFFRKAQPDINFLIRNSGFIFYVVLPFYFRVLTYYYSSSSTFFSAIRRL